MISFKHDCSSDRSRDRVKQTSKFGLTILIGLMNHSQIQPSSIECAVQLPTQPGQMRSQSYAPSRQELPGRREGAGTR